MKKCFLPLFISILFFVLPFSVNAANLCTESKYNALKQKASKVEANWNLKFDEKNNAYFEVSFNNVDDDLLLLYNNVYYEPSNSKIELVTLLEGGNTYEFNFYGGYDNPCVEEYLYTKKLEIPKYNKFSEMKECSEYTEWDLCDKWYSGYIESEEDFYNKLEEYKEKIKTGEIVLGKKGKNNYALYTLIFGFTLIVLICAYKFIKKKKKNK